MKKLILAIAFMAFTAPIHAQEQGLGGLVDSALKAMNEGNWEEAAKLNTEAVDRFGENPAMAYNLYGPQFGVIYYRKGICEMKLNQFDKAMGSFESAYKHFPNKEDTPPGSGNLFHKMALLKLGEAAMGAEKYELAIENWKKFLEERNKARDTYPQGAFHINMAICHYRLGKLEEGSEHLEIAITNKNRFPTPNAAIVSGFQALVTAAIELKNEQLLLDFVEKNRGALVVAPFEMQRFSKLFMKLAGDAIAAKMLDTALTLYQFVPSTQVAINDLRVRLKDMGGLTRINDGPIRLNKERLEAELAALETEQRGNKSIEMIKLAAAAYIFETTGNIRGAYTAYLQLEKQYANAENREDNLYHLVRTSSMLGDVASTQLYGEKFLKLFPNSKHLSDGQKMLLSSLFFDGKYEASIEIASDIIENGKAAEGSPEHDLALFVLAGSHFYTGQYDKAAPLLDQHVEKYPESPYIMSSEYFQASNASRLQYWKKAARLLDAFLAKHQDAADKGYIPLAIYDRANAHYSEEEPEAALDKLERVINEFPESPVTDQAYNLRGNVEQSEGDKEAAEQSYLKALEIAEARGNAGVAGESLYYLVALLGEQAEGDDPGPRLADAVPFAEKYWEKYSAGSPYRAQVAVAQVPAYNAAGRSDEALERLQAVISDMAKMTQAAGLEAAINSYTEAYLQEHTPEELKEHYYNFPDIRTTDKAARALLRIAIIGVFEDVAKDAEDEDRKRAANAMIQVLFRNLKTDFDLKDLSNYILVKLGDYLRTNTSAPLEALPYYNETLSRQDQAYRFGALLGRADVYGNSDVDADLAKAIEDFERIFADSDEKGQREFALYRIIQILMKKGDHAEAAKRANEYLNRDKESGPTYGFGTYTPEVGLMLAESFEERGMVDDAISMYVKVMAAHTGYIKVSADAVKSAMELFFARNKKSEKANVASDRQGAYNTGYAYIKNTRPLLDKMTDEELELWKEVEELVEQYVADPNVKSAAQLEKEKENR